MNKSVLAYNRRRGMAMVWTAIMLFLMIGFIGLSTDWAKLMINVHQLHNSTDAAALAGAQKVKHDPAGARTRSLSLADANPAEQLPVSVALNPSNNPVGDIVLGRWVRQDRSFFPTLDAPNAVKVVAHREDARDGVSPTPAAALVFGPIFGRPTARLKRESVAWCFDSSGAGLICLSPDRRPGLSISGTASLDVENGGIHVNSEYVGKNQKAGTYIGGNATVDCGQINAVGGTSPDADAGDEWTKYMTDDDGTYHPFPVNDRDDGVARIEDPVKASMLANPDDPLLDYTYGDRLDLPELINNGIPTRTVTADGQAITGPISATATLAPGYYPNGIRLSTSGQTITLDPTAGGYSGEPVYVFGGNSTAGSESGLFVNGGNIIGHGVTCYVTQNFSSGTYGVTRLMGNGTIDLLSPGDWENKVAGTFDPLKVEGRNGIVVWQDPTNANEAHFNGGGDFSTSGTLYFPEPIHCRLEGNLGEAGNQIVCGSAEVLGTALITVNYDGRNSGVASGRSYLVK